LNGQVPPSVRTSRWLPTGKVLQLAYDLVGLGNQTKLYEAKSRFSHRGIWATPSIYADRLHVPG
jgi:hypothetical protein